MSVTGMVMLFLSFCCYIVSEGIVDTDYTDQLKNWIPSAYGYYDKTIRQVLDSNSSSSVSSAEPYYYPSTYYVKHGHVPYQDGRLLIVNTNGVPAITGRDESGFQRTTSRIYADIVNVSNQTLYDIEIGIRTYDNKGRMIDPDEDGHAEDTFFLKTSLGPGESSIARYVPEITNWKCYEIFVKTYALEDEIIFPGDIYYNKGGLEITVFSVDRTGKYTVEVKNTSDRYIHKIFAVIMKRDSDNHIIGEKIIPMEGLKPNQKRQESFTGYLQGYNFERTLDIWKYEKPEKLNVFAVGWHVDTRFPGKGYLSSYEENRFEVLPSVISEFRSNFFHSKNLTMSHLDHQQFEIASQKITGECNTHDKESNNKTYTHYEQDRQKKGTKAEKLMERENRKLVTVLPGRFMLSAQSWIDQEISDKKFAEEIKYLIHKNIVDVQKKSTTGNNIDSAKRNDDAGLASESQSSYDSSHPSSDIIRKANPKESQPYTNSHDLKNSYPYFPSWFNEVVELWLDDKISTRLLVEIIEYLHDRNLLRI